MRPKIIKILSLIVSLTMLSGIAAGCGGKADTSSDSSDYTGGSTYESSEDNSDITSEDASSGDESAVDWGNNSGTSGSGNSQNNTSKESKEPVYDLGGRTLKIVIKPRSPFNCNEYLCCL